MPKNIREEMKSIKKPTSVILTVLTLLAAILSMEVLAEVETVIIPTGDYTITEDGEYQLSENYSGTITVGNSANTVTVVGSVYGTPHDETNIFIEGERSSLLKLTIENLDIATTSNHGIDFASAGNFDHGLYISGANQVVTSENGKAGIHVPQGVRLTIDKSVGLSDEEVQLTASGGSNGAGIGGGKSDLAYAGSITINGGTITANGGSNAAGIGCGNRGSVDSIIINGGIITANGGSSSTGIGVGYNSWQGDITINGGTITANGGESGGSGIGSGKLKVADSPLNITINGGTITANGGDFGGSGIGSSADQFEPYSANININGGTIIANGGSSAAGIGGGGSSSGCPITISGGTTTATGGDFAAGIGGGKWNSSGCPITISGGTITATGGSLAAGIGGGSLGNGGTVIITGKPEVIATGDTSNDASHIGSGYDSTNEGTLKNSTGDDLSYLRFNTGIAEVKVALNNNEYITNDQGLTGVFAPINNSPATYTVSKAAYEAVKGSQDLSSMNYDLEVTMIEDNTPPTIGQVTPLLLNQNLSVEVTLNDDYGIFGALYLVPKGDENFASKANLDDIDMKKTVSVESPAMYAEISPSGLTDGIYQVYLVDSAENVSLPSADIQFDSTAPTVVLSHNNDSTVVKQGDAIIITAAFDKDMADSPTVTITNGGVEDSAMASDSGDKRTWTYTWTVPDGDASAIVTVAGSDIAGNNYAGDDNLTFTIDNFAPEVVSVNVPEDGIYCLGLELQFNVEFSKQVIVDTMQGAPSIDVNIGGQNETAGYIGGSGSRFITFSYTLEEGLEDQDGIAIDNEISLNGGTLKSAAGHDAVLTLNNIEPTTGIKVDTIAPSLVSSTVISNLTYTGVALSWNKAADNYSPQETLQYLVYQSDSNNIDTVQNMEANGIAIGSYEANINSREIKDLISNATYYFNVMVEDEAGNKTAYTMISVTLEPFITDIEITTPPTKTTYVTGQSFDPTGMVVTATYNDGTTAEITDYTIDPSGSLSTTDTKVTINYLGHSAEQAITVSSSRGIKRTVPAPQPGETGSETDTIVIGGDHVEKETTTTDDGKTVETFTVKAEAQEQITKAKEESKTTVEINIPGNQDAVTVVNVPADVLQSTAGMNVTVDTPNATLELPADLVEVLATAGQSLSLTVERGNSETASAHMSGVITTEGARVLGTPTVINTAITGNTNVTIPLTGIIFPDNPGERDRFLNSLAVFAIHSDGDKTVKTGEIVFDADDNPAGIKFTVHKFSTFAVIKLPEKPAVTLTDIDEHWAEGNIRELIAAGAIAGYPDYTFRPNNNITRGEFVAILVKAFNLEGPTGKVFADTAEHWAKEYISIAASNEVVTGYDETTFGSNDLITREQMAVMVTRAAKLDLQTGEMNFSDAVDIAPWAVSAVFTAVRQGIITGYPDNTFKPKENATRAEAATVIVQAIK